FTKVTTLEPTNVRGFLALGATDFNRGDMDAAEVAWLKALDIDDKNVDAHYDLGFLYFNRQPPDMAKVQEHWAKVVELDPESQIAQTVKAHLGAIASMVPASPAPSGSPAASPEASAAPSASPAASAAATPAPSPAPSGSTQP
ncbi:MAG: tetratricopeptide repeat protein, partial [Chloroflexota bacterium]